MRVLELFSGTGSVGKVAKELGWTVVSLDLKNADIETNILDWNYKQYNPHDFDIIWSSPPCHTFSKMRESNFGRKLREHHGEVFTRELLNRDIEEKGLPILRRTEEIIDYFVKFCKNESDLNKCGTEFNNYFFSKKSNKIKVELLDGNKTELFFGDIKPILC